MHLGKGERERTSTNYAGLGHRRIFRRLQHCQALSNLWMSFICYLALLHKLKESRLIYESA
jgi:hypothetical protein